MSTIEETGATRKRLPLSARQILILSVYGAIVWLVAALALRTLGPLGIYEGWSRVWLYLLIIPGTVPLVPIAQRVAGLATDQVAIGFALATAIAIMLDGLALAWTPWLYGGAVELVAGAGATILWGGGVGLVIGFWFNRASG